MRVKNGEKNEVENEGTGDYKMALKASTETAPFASGVKLENNTTWHHEEDLDFVTNKGECN